MLALLQQPQLLAWLGEELDQLAWPPAADKAAAAYEPTRAPRLDAVVQEVLHYTPPVGGFFRRTTAECDIDVGIYVRHQQGASRCDQPEVFYRDTCSASIFC